MKLTVSVNVANCESVAAVIAPDCPTKPPSAVNFMPEPQFSGLNSIRAPAPSVTVPSVE